MCKRVGSILFSLVLLVGAGLPNQVFASTGQDSKTTTKKATNKVTKETKKGAVEAGDKTEDAWDQTKKGTSKVTKETKKVGSKIKHKID